MTFKWSQTIIEWLNYESDNAVRDIISFSVKIKPVSNAIESKFKSNWIWNWKFNLTRLAFGITMVKLNFQFQIQFDLNFDSIPFEAGL